MENQVSTIVCPNCGASTTNHKNCDYCGSFLVQRVSKGIDVASYVEYSKSFDVSGVEKIIKQYLDTLVRLNMCDGLFLSACIGDDKWIQITPSRTDDYSLKGIEMELAESLFNKGTARFKNSPLFKTFSVKEVTLHDYPGGPVVGREESYMIEFGQDYKGAAKVFVQLLTDVFNIELQDVIFYERGFATAGEDEDDYYNEDEIQFNYVGDVIASKGDGVNGFENPQHVLSEYNDHIRYLKKQDAKGSGCAGMLLIMISAGFALMWSISKIISLVV